MSSEFSKHYEQLRPIGEGAGAQVFSVRDLITDKIYALKIAHAALAKHAMVRNRWKREISMHARFEHPNIVPLVDYGTMDKGEPYIIMGLAQSAMDAEMKKGTTIEQLLVWIEQVLHGLGYLHARNIIHQDFKTENVLINDQGEAWIIDFSVARTMSELRIHPNEITGTMGWMAPEQQLKQIHHIGPWTDIYAVGKIFELLKFNIKDASPISHILDTWVSKNPYDRPVCAADAIEDLYTTREKAYQIQEDTGIDWLQQHVIIKQLPPPQSIKKEMFLENIAKSNFVSKELEAGTLARRLQNFESSKSMGGYTNPRLFLHRDPMLYLWKELKKKIIEGLQYIYHQKSPKALIFEGSPGTGSNELIRAISTDLTACGLMDSIGLRYLQLSGQGGVYEALKEDIFPYGESIEDMLLRVQRQIQLYLDIPSEQAQQQAIALARWCGIMEDPEMDIDSSMGLVFLFKKMARNSNRIGTCLSMFHPERSNHVGEGLHICASILNQSVGRRRILILASVDKVEEQLSPDVDIDLKGHSKKELEQNTSKENTSKEKYLGLSSANEKNAVHKSLFYVDSLGAQRIHLEVSFEKLQDLLKNYYLLDSSLISDVCSFSQGKIGNIVLLLRFWVAEGYLVHQDGCMTLTIAKEKAFPKNRKQLLLGRLAPVLRGLNKPKIPALTRLMVLVSLLNIPPTETLLRHLENEGLEDALSLGLLRQRGRWIEFESEDYRLVILEHAQKFISISDYHVQLASYLDKDAKAINNPSAYIDIECRKAIALHWLSAHKYDQGIPILCDVAHTFFRIGLLQYAMTCADDCLDFIREQRNRVHGSQKSADEIESMSFPLEETRQEQIQQTGRYNTYEQNLFLLLARCYLKKRDYAQTWNWLRKCNLQTDMLQARALLMQAQLPRFFEHALDYLRQAESIYRSYNDDYGVAESQFIRAQVFLEQGSYVQSQLLFQSITEKVSPRKKLWSTAYIGLIHSKYRRGEDVGKSLNLFIEEARKSGNIYSLAYASFFGGISYMRSRNWQESERVFYVALALASTGGLVDVQAEIFSGLATCKALQGKIEEARQCHQQSYVLLKSHGLEMEMGVAQIRWLCTFLLDRPFEVFRQHMDRLQPLKDKPVQLWWSLCKMLRHSMIVDRQGTEYWWKKAQNYGIHQLWDVNVCFLLQAIVKSSQSHSPVIGKLVLQEVQRIYGRTSVKS